MKISFQFGKSKKAISSAGKRKVFIFFFSVLIGAACSFVMGIDYYEKYLLFLGGITLGYMGANGLVHFAQRNNDNGNQD